MNMFQHLQNYYVQPLEEENKKLRRELTDTQRSIALLKDENRNLTEGMYKHHKQDTHFLDQLKSYQYEMSCSPSFLTFEEEEITADESLLEESLAVPSASRTMRQAIKFMKFRSNMKLELMKHNGMHWYEPID